MNLENLELMKYKKIKVNHPNGCLNHLEEWFWLNIATDANHPKGWSNKNNKKIVKKFTNSVYENNIKNNPLSINGVKVIIGKHGIKQGARFLKGKGNIRNMRRNRQQRYFFDPKDHIFTIIMVATATTCYFIKRMLNPEIEKMEENKKKNAEDLEKSKQELQAFLEEMKQRDQLVEEKVEKVREIGKGTKELIGDWLPDKVNLGGIVIDFSGFNTTLLILVILLPVVVLIFAIILKIILWMFKRKPIQTDKK